MAFVTRGGLQAPPDTRTACAAFVQGENVCSDDAEPMTPLGATSTNHGFATASTHTDKKAVRPLATHNRRLIGTFHDNFLIL
jgi:hypothetical protein